MTVNVSPSQPTLQTLIVLLMAISLAVITAAWGFELIGGYKPCPLCLQQRYAYYFAIPASAVALALAYQGQVRWAQLLLILCALAYILNTALGVYHSGVEWHWWQGPSGCAGGDLESLSLNPGQLLSRLKETKVIRCDEAPWSFLGLSFAGYNVLISLGLATLALAGTRRLSLS